MSLLLTIIGFALAVVFLILLSLGLFFALGILLLIGGVALVIALVFGDASWTSMTSTKNLADAEALKIPQAFNSCLLDGELDRCRRRFTHWEAEDIKIIMELSKQVKEELGTRDPNVFTQNLRSETVNGDRTVIIDQEVDFSKKKNVREYYLITTDNDDKDNPLKIKDLRWDY